MEPTAAPAQELEPAPAPAPAPPPPRRPPPDLPAEVIVLISELLVPGEFDEPYTPALVLQTCRDAVAMMGVCRAWRAAVEEPLRLRLATLTAARWHNAQRDYGDLAHASLPPPNFSRPPGWLPTALIAEVEDACLSRLFECFDRMDAAWPYARRGGPDDRARLSDRFLMMRICARYLPAADRRDAAALAGICAEWRASAAAGARSAEVELDTRSMGALFLTHGPMP